MPFSTTHIQTRNVIFYLNNVRTVINLNKIPAFTRFSDYLKSKKSTGTKTACLEGGCGACTVMMSRFDHSVNRIVHHSVLACLLPVIAVDGTQITTIEGLGNVHNPHPLQKAFAELNATQCGYCTPGFIMAIYAACCDEVEAAKVEKRDVCFSPELIRHHLDGNICRCTGYAPINAVIDVITNKTNSTIKEFGGESQSTTTASTVTDRDIEDITLAKNIVNKPIHYVNKFPEELISYKESGLAHNIYVDYNALYGISHNLDQDDDFKAEEAHKFLAEWMPVRVMRPVCMNDLKAFYTEMINKKEAVKVVTGCTEILVDQKNRSSTPKNIALITPYFKNEADPNFDKVYYDAEKKYLNIGAAVTVADFVRFLEKLEKKTHLDRAFIDTYAIFASQHVRELATVAANIANGSPVGDTLPILMAANAEIIIYDVITGVVRSVPADKFIVSYRRSCLSPSEIVSSIRIPDQDNVKIYRHKLARRMEDDIAIINGCGSFNIKDGSLEEISNNENTKNDPIVIIGDVRIAFGCLSTVTKRLIEVENLLKNQSFTIEQINKLFTEDIENVVRANYTLPLDAPGGCANYRTDMTVELCKRFFMYSLVSTFGNSWVVDHIRGGLSSFNSYIPMDDKIEDSIENLYKTRSVEPKVDEIYNTSRPEKIVGKAVKHASGLLQCTGEASFASTMELPSGTLHAYPIFAGIPRGILKGLPTKEEIIKKLEKSYISGDCGQEIVSSFVDFITAEDIILHNGRNSIGVAVLDEELLVPIGNEIKSPSAMLAIVIAKDSQSAYHIAHICIRGLIKIEDKSDTALTMIEDCLREKAFVCERRLDKFDEKFVKEKLHYKIPNLEKYGKEIKNNDEKFDALKNSLFPELSNFDQAAQLADISTRTANKKFVVVKNDNKAVAIQGTFFVPGQEHFYLETQGSIAIPHEGDEMEVIAGTQNITGTQKNVAACLGIQQNRVTVRVKRLGGGFGAKEGWFGLSCVAALAARKTKCPVSLFLDRWDDMLYTGKRHDAKFAYSIVLDRSTGKIVLLDIDLACDAGFSTDLSPAVMERMLLHVDGCYNIPILRTRGKSCRTNARSSTAFRGFGGPQACIFIEHILNQLVKVVEADHGFKNYIAHKFITEYPELASRLEGNLDTMDRIRFINFYHDGDVTHFGQTLVNIHIERAYSECLLKSEIGKRRKQIAEFNATHSIRKRAIAAVPLRFGVSFCQSFLNQGSALVHVMTDGSVCVAHGGIEMGQGLNTRIQQVAAEVFGIPLSYIYVKESSTDTCVNTSPTSASSGFDINGAAVKDACEKIKVNMQQYYKDYESGKLAWNEACNSAWFNRKCLSSVGYFASPVPGFNFDTQLGQPFAYFATGASVSEVEIDSQTGEFIVRRSDVIFDTGKSLNPALDIGQIEGAFIQGQGWLTTEELLHFEKLIEVKNSKGELVKMLKRTGKPMSTGPGNYKVPTLVDIPEIFNVELLKNSDNTGRACYGTKGIGEPPFVLANSVPLAISNACYEVNQENEINYPATVVNIRAACKK